MVAAGARDRRAADRVAGVVGPPPAALVAQVGVRRPYSGRPEVPGHLVAFALLCRPRGPALRRRQVGAVAVPRTRAAVAASVGAPRAARAGEATRRAGARGPPPRHQPCLGPGHGSVRATPSFGGPQRGGLAAVRSLSPPLAAPPRRLPPREARPHPPLRHAPLPHPARHRAPARDHPPAAAACAVLRPPPGPSRVLSGRAHRVAHLGARDLIAPPYADQPLL